MTRLCSTEVPFYRVIVLLLILGLVASPSWATPTVDKTFPTQTNPDVTTSAQDESPTKGAIFSNRIWSQFWERKERDMEGENVQIPFPQTDENKNKTDEVESPLFSYPDWSEFWAAKERDMEGKSFQKETSTSANPSFQTDKEDENKTEKVESPLLSSPLWSNFSMAKERDMEGKNVHKEESTSFVSSSSHNVPSPGVPVSPVTTSLPEDDSRLLENDAATVRSRHEDKDMTTGSPSVPTKAVYSTTFEETNSSSSPSRHEGTAVEQVGWNAQQWVEMWENAIPNRPQERVSGQRETQSVVLDSQRSSSGVPSTPSTTDEMIESRPKGDAQKWINMWKNAMSNATLQRQTTENVEIDRVISEMPGVEELETSPVPYAPSADEGLMKDHPKGDAMNMAELWENAIKKLTPESKQNEINSLDQSNTPTISSSTLSEKMQQKNTDWNVEHWIKLWDDATHQLLGKQHDYPLVDNDHSSSTHVSSVMPGETTVNSQLLSQTQNKNELLNKEIHSEDTTDSLAENDKDLGPDNANSNFNLWEQQSNNSKVENSEISTLIGNLLRHRQKVESGQLLELRDGTKMPAEDGPSSESDDKTISMVVFTAIIGGFCVFLLVLICVFIFCLCFKNQAKSFSEKTKSLTTMNTDGNRIDLQILRPSQKSLDAFTFGLPIPTVDESLRTVVVDPPITPYLKY